MSKKKRKKKQKSKFRNLNYTKTEFVEEVCSECRICKPGTDPVFCYDETYVKDPKIFMSVIHENLIKARDWLLETDKSSLRPDDEIQQLFQMGFCESNYCGLRPDITDTSCRFLIGCLSAFRNQKKNPKGKVIDLSEYRGRKKEKSQKTKTENVKCRLYTPEPTFFCNEGFREEVDKIVKEYLDSQNGE